MKLNVDTSYVMVLEIKFRTNYFIKLLSVTCNQFGLKIFTYTNLLNKN